MGKTTGPFLMIVGFLLGVLLICSKFKDQVGPMLYNAMMNRSRGTEGVDYLKKLDPNFKGKNGRKRKVKSIDVSDKNGESFQVEIINKSETPRRDSARPIRRHQIDDEQSEPANKPKFRESPFKQSRFRNGNRRTWKGESKDADLSPF